MLEARCRSQRGQSNGPCGVFWRNKKYLTECKKQTSERLLRQYWPPLCHKHSWISLFKANAPNNGSALSLQTNFIWSITSWSIKRKGGRQLNVTTSLLPVFTASGISPWQQKLQWGRGLFLTGTKKGGLPVTKVTVRTCHGSWDQIWSRLSHSFT